MDSFRQAIATEQQQLLRMPTSLRSRRWCFTLNNYTDADVNALKLTRCKWIIFGKETGSSGTPHLQGALILLNPSTLNALKKKPGFSRAHLSVMKGTPEQNRAYCSKEDFNAFEKGTMPQPGKRNDLANAVAELRAGKSVRDLAQDESHGAVVVKYYKGLIKYSSLVSPHRDSAPTVYWLYGPTGAFKTFSAVSLAKKAKSFWMSNGTLQWFDGYEGQEVAIFDDLRHQHCKFDYLLRLLDRYDMLVPYKGGFVQWIPRLIMVTAPYAPQEMWNLRQQGDIAQLLRRITSVIEMPRQRDSLFFHQLPWVANSVDEESIDFADDSSSDDAVVAIAPPTPPTQSLSCNEPLMISDSESENLDANQLLSEAFDWSGDLFK